MKVVYCDDCKDISIKSRFERDVCNSCGRSARLMPHARPWQYYASSGILLVATAILVLLPIADLAVRVGILVAALVIALALSSWSVKTLRVRVLKSVQDAAEAKT